jgi:aspartyl-tRNA synthetase
MAYVDEEDIYPVVDGLMAQLWKTFAGRPLTLPVRKLTYAQSMLRYGTDRPDLRFALEIEDATTAAKRWPIPDVREAMEAGPDAAVRALRIPADIATFEQGFLEGLPTEMRRFGEAYVTWFKVGPNDTIFGRVAEHLDVQLQRDVIRAANAKMGDAVVLVAARHWATASAVAGEARLAIGRQQRLIDKERQELVWIHQFPYWEYDPIARGWTGARHPFTQPLDEDLPRLEADKHGVRTKAYDLVLNGVELGAGSIRITDPDLQKRIFDMFEYPSDEVMRRFGFVTDAFRFGVPPHGGLSIGLDRLIAQLVGAESTAEVIAFPKNQQGRDLMLEAPSMIDAGFVRAMLLP